MRILFLSTIFCLLAFSILADYQPDFAQDWNEPCEFHEDCYQEDNCFFIGAGVGYLDFYRLPGFQYGQFLSNLEAIPYLEARNESADSAYYEAFIGYNLQNAFWDWMGCNSCVTLSGHYFDDQNSSSFFETPPTGSSVIALPGLNALPSSTGFVAVADTILDGELRRKYGFWGGDINLNTSYFFDINCLSYAISPFIQFGIHQFNQSYKIRLHREDTITVDFDLSERVKTTYYDLGGGLELSFYPLSQFCFYVNGGIYASYANSDFAGDTFLSTSAGAIRLSAADDQYNTWNSKVKANAGLTYSYCNFLFEIVGKYEYWGYAPLVANPLFVSRNLNFDHTARISNSFASLYSIGGRISYLF